LCEVLFIDLRVRVGGLLDAVSWWSFVAGKVCVSRGCVVTGTE